ncbi:MAG: U32 family peptidase [bacterium]|nr:MAG: U32 family peptidase [bacterium]
MRSPKDPFDTPAQILAPVNALAEVEPLLEAGADWLYGGCLPGEWTERYPATVLLNQRTFASAQFASLDELEAAVRMARRSGGRFALTLNAPFYMDEQMELALDMAGWAADVGVGALIVADPGLMVRVREAGIAVPMHLSTMGLGSNAPAVRLFAELGVTRVILPRFLNLRQVAMLVEQVPEVEYEAFILVGKCPNVEGVCTFLHDSPDLRWPCEWDWEISGPCGERAPEAVTLHFKGMRDTDRRDACGLCALPALLSGGVNIFKVVGRGAPLDRKVLMVTRLRRLMAGAREGSGPQWIQGCMEAYRSLFGHPCSPQNCYYPEALQE